MSSAELYCKGARVWLPDATRVWVPGTVVIPLCDGVMVVEREGEGEGETVTIDNLPPLRNPDILVGANDLTSLSYLHEPAVLHNLMTRFLESYTIYTYCGIVLVAINPYKPLPIYGNDIANAYSGRELGEMDPHIFAVAEEAYRKMAREKGNQSIIVSGESGAGKTVSAKYAMRYFATVGGASVETQIERKVLASNPVMEAIGNAKTTRNDNSSRFGKYIELGFNCDHRIIGANMRTYLLEKSRVVSQSSEERNYHIFYQLCASRGLPEFGEFCLGHPDEFHYTNQGGCVTIDDINDQSNFSAVREALQLLGFLDNQQMHIFRVLAAILHLGNVEIGSSMDEGDEACHIDDLDPHLQIASVLLGVDHDQLHQWLCHRRIVTTREAFTKPLTPPQAVNARDGLSKHLYSHLFQWIVDVINRILQSGGREQQSFIGVLDIYGFEVFQVNSFEQFCINYANEKLQQQFNMHVFKLEQQEYIKEAIEWSFIDFHDNQPCIDLIESKLGILDLLDETCRMPKASDELLIQKLYSSHQNKSSHFVKPRLSTTAFSIHHYAGLVEYESEGVVEKNVDSVIEEHITVLRKSRHPLVAELFNIAAKPNASSILGKKRAGMITRATVGSQFRDSLSGLMSTLNNTTPHYIRCIKPNDNKTPFEFDPQRATQQLRACGVLETIRISAAGFPSRWLYQEFFERYRMLLSSGQVRRDEERLMSEYILHKTIKDVDKYRLGNTKVFFRAGQVAYLEKLRSDKLYSSGVLIQKYIRGWLQQRRYQRLRAATILIQAHSKGLLARRLATFLRKTRAAVSIQRNVRSFICKRWYQNLRKATVVLQACYRGGQARREYKKLREGAKATLIQRCARGWLARRAYRHALRCVLLAQCCVRRWLAKRELKKLKVEARSVSHLKKLNCGLENKIIELQQKLLHQLEVNRKLNGRCKCLEEEVVAAQLQGSCVDALRLSEEQVKELEKNLAFERVSRTMLEEEMNKMKEVALQKEKEIVDYKLELETLKRDLQSIKAADIELTQLKEHHQKVLTDYSTLEQQCALMQKELGDLKHNMEDPAVADILSTSIPSPPFSESHASNFGKLFQPNHPHPIASTPGTPLYINPDSLDLIQTPATLAKEQEMVFISDMKMKNGQLERERERPIQEKERLEERLLEISTTSSNKQDRRCQKLERVNASLVREVASLKHALKQSDFASSLNITLQQEVTRLTEENLNLLETLEVIQHQSRSRGGLPITPHSPRRKTNPCGAVSPRKRTAVRFRGWEEQTPALGMLSWQPEDQSKLIKALVLDLRPELFHGQIPCLPAHMIFMCLRYLDHCNNQQMIAQFTEGIVTAIDQVMQRNEGNLELLSFWLANVTRLMHNLEQYNGDQSSSGSVSSTSVSSQHSSGSSQPSLLINSDLTEYYHSLSDKATAIYHDFIQTAQTRVQPLIIPGIMEHEAIQGLSGSRPIGSKRVGSHDITVEMVVKELSDIRNVLERNYVDPTTVGRIMKQVFYMIGAYMLNNLLLRKEMCHWSRGMQMRYNISRLEDWVHRGGLAGAGLEEQLQPIVQAAKLLQMKKSSPVDAEAICELCSQLNPLQVQKILTMYTPANEYEERVPVTVIRLVAQKSGADRTDPAHLMVDINHVFAVEFPYTYSDVNYRSIAVPDFLKLDCLVKL